MLYDAFIYKRHGNEYLVDCDRTVTGDFLFYLRRFRLRSQVEVDDVSSDYLILSSWNHGAAEEPTAGSIVDKRCPEWSMERQIVANDSSTSCSVDTTIYDMIRMINGIAEGPAEITRNKAIPLEFNMDLMGAIDAHKGCYMGQELVTRTLSRGIVRKRIVPVRLHEWDNDRASYVPDAQRAFPGIEPGSDLHPVEPREAQRFSDVTTIESERSFGKITRIVGNTGLAIVRLSEMPPQGLFAVHRPIPDGGKPTFVLGEAVIPSWWPSSVRSS